MELTADIEATAGSDQAPGALRNYSFKLSSSQTELHLLAAKQPEVGDWITAINAITGKGGNASPRPKSSSLTEKKVVAPPSKNVRPVVKANPRDQIVSGPAAIRGGNPTAAPGLPKEIVF